MALWPSAAGEVFVIVVQQKKTLLYSELRKKPE